MENLSSEVIVLLLIGAITIIIVIIVFLSSYNSRCKSCGKWWCDEEYKDEFIEQVRKRQTEHIYTDHVNMRNGERSYSVTHVPVTVTYNRYKIFMRCKYCGDEWTITKDYKV